MIDPRREYDKRVRKAPIYEEIVENTHSRALYVPSPCKNEAKKETLKRFNIKRLIEEVLEQKQLMMVPNKAPVKGFLCPKNSKGNQDSSYRSFRYTWGRKTQKSTYSTSSQ